MGECVVRTEPLKMPCCTYCAARNKSRLSVRTCQAHIALYHTAQGTLLFTNWGRFYHEVALEHPALAAGTEGYRATLQSKGCTHLAQALFEEQSPVRFAPSPRQPEAWGLTITVPPGADVEAAVAQLLEFGKQLILEIRSAEGLSREKVATNQVWIRE